MNGGLKRLADGLLELVYPLRAECMGCGSAAGFARDWLCGDCGRRQRWPLGGRAGAGRPELRRRGLRLSTAAPRAAWCAA